MTEQVVDETHLLLLHRGDEVPVEQLRAVVSAAIEVGLDETKHVSALAMTAAPIGPNAACQTPRRADGQLLRLLRVGVVTDRDWMDDRLVGERDRVLETERLEDPLS